MEQRQALNVLHSVLRFARSQVRHR
uniref:Uncharacterized protein n=1 Tax=Arundo donax TaxID=35708 RepID=A0A0A9H931_ARUDO